MSRIFLLSLLSLTFLSCPALKADDTTNPRIQWKEFDSEDVREFVMAGCAPAAGKFDLKGTMNVAYSDKMIFPMWASATIGGKTCPLKTEFFPLGFIKHSFAKQAPFEKDTYRNMKLDFRITSNGDLGSVRAFVSLKPTRDVSFRCTWGEADKGDDSDHGTIITLSEDAKTAQIRTIWGKGKSQPIPTGLTGTPPVQIQSSGPDGIVLTVAWPDGGLDLKQRGDQQTDLFDGQFKVGSEKHSVTCGITKND